MRPPEVSKLLTDSGSKMVEQMQERVATGSRTRQLIEARASTFQDKAKDFVIKSMNDMSQDLLKAGVRRGLGVAQRGGVDDEIANFGVRPGNSGKSGS